MSRRWLAAVAAWAVVVVLALQLSFPAATDQQDPRECPPIVAPNRGDDTTRLQAFIDAGSVIPPGTFYASTLRLPANGARGSGRDVTTIVSIGPGPLLSATGTARMSYFELAHGPQVTDLSLSGNGGTGLRLEGEAYFTLSGLAVRGFDVGIDLAGSLQGEIRDALFSDDAIGIRLRPGMTGYAGTVPPNRVLIDWSSFYCSSRRAVDFSGGEQVIIRDSEFGGNGTAGDQDTATIWVEASRIGLVGEGLWIESGHGRAGIVLRGAASHALRDSAIAYTVRPIEVEDGHLACENVVGASC